VATPDLTSFFRCRVVSQRCEEYEGVDLTRTVAAGVDITDVRG